MPLASQIELPERYRVDRHIASGGMASVWEAEDLMLGRVVAVKVLGAQYADDPGARERFQREARTAAQVSDQTHVVTIYDIGEHGRDAFIVMEYFAGGTVADRLRAARKAGESIPRDTALRWLREAAAGLDVAHAAGIVHRDVKPANLLLDAGGRLAVADFGIARLADDSQMTQTGQVLGTAAYISPEQARGLPASDASDRYALAVVAYELLTGSRPFHGGPATAQALAHAESPPPRPSHASPELPRAVDPVFERALAKDPAQRPASASEFVAALEDALGEEPAGGPDPTQKFAAVPPTKATEPLASDRPGDGRAPAAAAGAAAAGGVAAGIAAASDAAGADPPVEPANAKPSVADPPPVEPANAKPSVADPPPAEPANAKPSAEPAKRDPDEPARAPAAAATGAAAEPAAAASGPAARPRPIAPQPPRPGEPRHAPGRPVPPGPGDRRRGAPGLLLAVLAAVALIALVLVLSSGGDDPEGTANRDAGSTQTQPSGERTATTPASEQPAPPPPPPPAAASGLSAAALNEQGHRLNQQERYAEAVAPLQASVAKYREAGDKGLPYAYALYNLGVALNRSGNPGAAVPVLEERLTYDNQRETVQAELNDALAALGQEPSGDGDDKPGKGNQKDKKNDG